MCAHHVGMCQQPLGALQPQPNARPQRKSRRSCSGRRAPRAARMCRSAVATCQRLLLALLLLGVVEDAELFLLLRCALSWCAELARWAGGQAMAAQ